MDRGNVPSRGRKEAVFSSSGDRIRAGNTDFEVVGSAVASEQVPPNRITAWTRRAAESLFSVIFPSDCRICNLPLLNISNLPVCPTCLDEMLPIAGRVCSICGERVLSVYGQRGPDGLRRCPVCRRIERPFERAVAYGSYEEGLRELVHLLKFEGVRPAARVLGGMLADVLFRLEPEFEQERVLVVPVPLFKGKRHERGFNQAELIARAAVKRCPARERYQLAFGILQRIRDTHSQIGLTSHQRRENLRGAFAVARAQEVTGREIVLVDDVYTTGTTATECARVLRRAGAARVWVATVARTLKIASKYLEVEEIGSPERAGFEVAEFQGLKGEGSSAVCMSS